MCALFGILDYKGIVPHWAMQRIVKSLAICSEVRGTDASGIAFTKNEEIVIKKWPKPAKKVQWKFPSDTKCVMGHTRMTTQGNASFNANNHPFPGKLPGVGGFALAHNGIITNDLELRICKNLPETCILTDSYIAVQLIEQSGKLNFGTLKEMAESLEGIFTFTVLSNHNILYIVKGENPICIYHYPELGFYMYASTPEIMEAALRMMHLTGMGSFAELKVRDGEILCIRPDGSLSKESFNLPVRQTKMWYHSWENGYLQEELADDEVQILCETFGLTQENIYYLIECGMDFEEIEAMLFDGGRLHPWSQTPHCNECLEDF